VKRELRRNTGNFPTFVHGRPLGPPSSPSVFGHLGDSLKIRAGARDLQSRLDPETSLETAPGIQREAKAAGKASAHTEDVLIECDPRRKVLNKVMFATSVKISNFD
jgi:hypothetical protein